MNGTEAKERARTLLDLNRPQQALDLLREALASAPDDAEALRLCGRAHLNTDRTLASSRLAVAALEASLRAEPENAEGWRLISLAYSRLRRHKDARAAAKRGQTLEPHNWASYAMIAHADATAKRINKHTRAAVAEAIRIAPNEPEVYFAAGRVAAARGFGRRASREYAKALALNPNHVGARNNLAVVQLASGDTGRAAAGFIGLLAEDPYSELGIRNLRVTARRIILFLSFVVLAVIVSLARIYNDTPLSSTGYGSKLWAVVLPLAGLAAMTGYLAWVRRKSGREFGKLVRSVPRVDRSTTAFATVLAAAYAALLVAMFLPAAQALYVYRTLEPVLFILVIGWNVIANLLEVNRSNGVKRRGGR